ncbi:MAG: hypothetical protein ABIE23_03890 [archaeon]
MKKLILLLALLVLFSPISFSQEETPPEVPVEETPPEPPMEEAPVEEAPPEPPVEEVFGEEVIPEGCHKVETGTGMSQLECDFDKEEFEEFDVKEELNECDGKFELIEGKPTCIKEGESGFIGTQCPTQEELDAVKSSCNKKIEEFKDEKGCNAVMCVNEEFKKKYDEKINEMYGDDPLKAEAIKCQKDGGEFTLIKGEPQCIGKGLEPISIKGELGEMSAEELSKAAYKLDQFQKTVGEVEGKLGPIKEMYEGEGKTEEAEAIGYGIEKLGEVKAKINEIKSDLSSGWLTTEEREEIIIEIQSLRREVLDVTKVITSGKVPTLEEIEMAVAEQFDKFYGSPFGSEEEFQKWVEAEKDALETVRGCEKYKETEKSFVPPDPEGMIVLVTLKYSEEVCNMTLNSKEGLTATYSVPPEGYKEFKGPERLPEFSCTGDCDKINEVFSMHVPEGPEEECMEDCVVRDCDGGTFECMGLNREKCELECGLKKEGDGPFGPGGQIDPFQGCIMVCVGDEADQCGPGGSNPKCIECEEKCMQEYGPGIGYERCLSGEQVDSRESECITQGQYGEPVEEQVMDTVCIVDIICKAYEPVGDDPGSGPDNWEPGHEPTGGFGLGGIPFGNLIEGIMNWMQGLFK